MATVYYVSYANCTDLEPRPGWYVSSEEGDPCGPFQTRAEAQDVTAEEEDR